MGRVGFTWGHAECGPDMLSSSVFRDKFLRMAPKPIYTNSRSTAIGRPLLVQDRRTKYNVLRPKY